MTDNNITEPTLSAADVAQYLTNHPDFFTEHPALLADLKLPHHSGSAVSLVERQVSVLRDRNMDMRHRLSHLLDNARDNDRLFDKTKRLILELLRAQDLGDLVDALHYSFDKEFNIQFTRLMLFGEPKDFTGSEAHIIPLAQAREQLGPLLKTNRALCGHLGERETAFIFADNAAQVGSAASVPLVNDKALGLLAIANSDPKHYRSSMGTLFLGYIAEVLNRVLPRYLP